MKLLALTVLTVAVITGVLIVFPPTDDFNATIVAIMAFTYTLAWGQMLLFRRHWPLRSLGIFWTYFADSVFWAMTLGSYLFHWHRDWEIALIVAAFLVGGPLFNIGVITYIIHSEHTPASRADGLP